jgi:prefoldin subunit 5
MLRTRLTIVVLALIAAATVARAEPLFELEDGGNTFLYRARPGDHPGRVAEMFGIPAEEVPALLRSNGIKDDTQVGSGFVYRIPNQAARELAGQIDTLRRERDRLAADAAAATQRSTAIEREARADRDAASAATARAERSQRLESLWPYMQLALVLLAIVTAAALAIARSSVSRHRQAERYAKTLAAELEERRKTGMAERQEAARHILDLEQRIRMLEAQLAPRRPTTTTGTTRAT